MENNLKFKDLLKIFFECGSAVFFISILFGLIYGLYTLVSLNWDEYIYPTVIYPLALLISNISSFIHRNLTIYSLAIILINFWLSCVNVKLIKRFKTVPLSISIFFSISILSGFTLFILNVSDRNAAMAFILLFSTCFFLCFFMVCQGIICNHKEDRKNRDDKQLSFDFKN